jgi:exodeoxyribonuclease VII small subunit
LTQPRPRGNVRTMARKAKASEGPRFEQLIDRLEEIVEQLESNELSLEEAIDAYQEGVEIAKDGHERLAAAERRIEELTRSGDKKTVDPEEVLGSEDGA